MNKRLPLWWILAMTHAACLAGAAVDGRKVDMACKVDELSVDLGVVLNDTRHRPTGINVDYLMDDDCNGLLHPERKLADALRELGVRYLRYPGGWKSAVNLWSVRPYSSSVPRLAGPVPDDWIRAGFRLTRPDGSWGIDPLDFDEFMELCRVRRGGLRAVSGRCL